MVQSIVSHSLYIGNTTSNFLSMTSVEDYARKWKKTGGKDEVDTLSE
jgi:hypothetical protein